MEDYEMRFSQEGSFVLPDDLVVRVLKGGTDVMLNPRDNCIGYGKVDRDVYVVVNGVLRAGYFDGNKEVTLAFTDIGTIFMSLAGYFTGKPAFIYYAACTKCLVKRIPKKYFDDVIEESPVFARWAYSVAIHQLYALERKVSLINGTVKERYIALIKNRPDIIKNVSMKVIASYLGVSPYYLCRLKKSLLNE
jgi:CRP-like cAMP-binding protein